MIPVCATSFPVNFGIPEHVWLVLDGAPPNYAAEVRKYLSKVFIAKRIGRRV